MLWSRDKNRVKRGRWHCRVKGQERARAYYRDHRDEVLAKNRAHRAAHKKPRARRYGITVAQYDEMLVAQDGRCAICLGAKERRHFDIDHDHETGRVRGLLCNRCNRLLSNARDDVALLEAAAAYLASRRDLLGRSPVQPVLDLAGDGGAPGPARGARDQSPVEDSPAPCIDCGGSRYVDVEPPGTGMVKCPRCKGSGVEDSPAAETEGEGTPAVTGAGSSPAGGSDG